jgi:hypothetical protein
MEPEGGTAVISRLVRTELESYLHDLVVWGGTAFFLLVLFFSFMGTVVARSEDPLSDLSGVFLLSVVLSSALLAVKVSMRNALEKRTRLFSQLPVSAREVSLASWCVRWLCLSIPTLACSVFLARAENMSFAMFALVTLATYLGGTTLVAAISVAMSIRPLASPMSAWAKGVYIACAIVAVVIWSLGNLLVLPAPAAIGSLADAGLPGMTGCLMVSSVGLVVVDVWLRDRADDYLG